MRWAPAAAALAVATAAVGVEATFAWTADSTLTTGVTGPHVKFSAGGGASNTRYFKSFAISPNATKFTADFRPKAGADATVKDVARLSNVAAGARTVTLTATQVANAHVERFTWTVKSGSSTIATVDALAPTPSATFTLPPGATYSLDVRIDLADGAGRHNAAGTFDLKAEAL